MFEHKRKHKLFFPATTAFRWRDWSKTISIFIGHSVSDRNILTSPIEFMWLGFRIYYRIMKGTANRTRCLYCRINFLSVRTIQSAWTILLDLSSISVNSLQKAIVPIHSGPFCHSFPAALPLFSSLNNVTETLKTPLKQMTVNEDLLNSYHIDALNKKAHTTHAGAMRIYESCSYRSRPTRVLCTLKRDTFNKFGAFWLTKVEG